MLPCETGGLRRRSAGWRQPRRVDAGGMNSGTRYSERLNGPLDRRAGGAGADARRSHVADHAQKLVQADLLDVQPIRFGDQRRGRRQTGSASGVSTFGSPRIR